MTDKARRRRNNNKLNEVDILHRRAFGSVIRRLEAVGFRPRIQEALRTEKRQALLVGQGKSHTMKSKHLNQSGMGAAAIDIVEDSAPFNPPPKFMAMTAIFANDVGLSTGLNWNKGTGYRNAVDNCIEKKAEVALTYVIETQGYGFDPLHIEVVDAIKLVL